MLKLNYIFEAILILATTLLLSYIFKNNYDRQILNFVFKLLLISAENSPGCAGSKNVKTPCLLFYFYYPRPNHYVIAGICLVFVNVQ